MLIEIVTNNEALRTYRMNKLKKDGPCNPKSDIFISKDCTQVVMHACPIDTAFAG